MDEQARQDVVKEIQMDPYYTLDDLQIITANELRDRVSQIQNSRAQQVALELWRRMDVVFSTSDPGSRKFLLGPRCLYDLLGPLGRELLLDKTRRLRSVNFNRILDGIADPTRDSRLPSGLNSPKPQKRKKHIYLESAERLHIHLESVLQGGQRMPFHQRRNLICTVLLASTAAALYLQSGWLLQQLHDAFWTLPLLLIGIGLVYGLWYRLTFWVEDKARIMALYIAFTDQFIDQGALIHDR
jgi:hypothetical protein